MYLSVACILIVGGMGYLWCTRGFYSALLNLICVLIAGAVAFGLWETIAYALLDKGTSGDLLSSSAWGIALALPFAGTVAVLRAVTDKVLGANVKIPDAANYVGGGICGAAAGIITAGIVVISLGMLRIDTEFLGYQRIGYGPSGASLKRDHGLILPVDMLVARLYGQMSRTTLATETPMAVYQPSLEDVPNVQRMNYGEGVSRNTIKPEDVRVIGLYTVGAENATLSSLLGDAFSGGSQPVADLNGDQFPAGSRVEGVVVSFTSGAKEKNGQVIIGPAQIRLVAKNDDGSESLALHPIAVVSRKEPAAKVNYARFRFDARELYVPSVGGDASTKMGFEFVVPKGYTPLTLYVKTTRLDLPARAETYASTGARDEAIKNGKLVQDTKTDIWEGGVADDTKRPNQRQLSPQEAEYWGVLISDALPNGAIIQDGTQGPDLQLSERRIINGKGRYEAKVVKNARDVDRALQVRQFRAPASTVLVQVNVSRGQKLSLLGRSAQAVERILPPLLISTDGQQFEPVGYYYEDEQKVLVRYTVDQPIRALAELDSDGVAPTVSRSDQQLILIFAPSAGVELKSWNFGSKVMEEFPRPIKTSG